MESINEILNNTDGLSDIEKLDVLIIKFELIDEVDLMCNGDVIHFGLNKLQANAIRVAISEGLIENKFYFRWFHFGDHFIKIDSRGMLINKPENLWSKDYNIIKQLLK